MPAGLRHQSAARGGSGIGWAGRAGHVQPWAPEAGGCGHWSLSEKRVRHPRRQGHTPPSAQQRDQLQMTMGWYQSVSSANRVFLS